MLIPPFEVNYSDILNQYSMSKEECEDMVDYVIKQLASRFYERWQEQAELELHSTRQRYLDNLHIGESGRLQGVIILDYTKDPLIKMIEEGIGAFDMKEGFSRSSKVKKNKSGGWYLTIPLAFGVPNTNGDSLGGITNLPQAVYNVAQKQVVSPITNQSKGLGVDSIPEEYRAPKSRKKIETPKSKIFEEYLHKSSIYQGVYKKTDTVTNQSSYGSFRRVGENSDPSAFIHPGINASNLAEKTKERFDSIMGTELTDAINNALRNFDFE